MGQKLCKASSSTLPVEWNYEQSVIEGKDAVLAFQKKSLELVRILYQARLNLSTSGLRTDILGTQNADLGQNCPRFPHTWEEYCQEIGLSKRTANSWLVLYLPDEDRMMNSQEVKEKFEQQYQEGKRQIIAHVGDGSWRPDFWSKAFESRYQEEKRLQLALQSEIKPAFNGPQIWLFDEPYLRSLAERVATYNEDLIGFQDFCHKVEKDACPQVPIQKQVKVYKLAKAALEDFEPTVRREVAKFVAEMIVRDSSGEF